MVSFISFHIKSPKKNSPIYFTDNPLVCECELIWFPNLLKDLKDKDDEMAQKKRPMCTMASEVVLSLF